MWQLRTLRAVKRTRMGPLAQGSLSWFSDPPSYKQPFVAIGEVELKLKSNFGIIQIFGMAFIGLFKPNIYMANICLTQWCQWHTRHCPNQFNGSLDKLSNKTSSTWMLSHPLSSFLIRYSSEPWQLLLRYFDISGFSYCKMTLPIRTYNPLSYSGRITFYRNNKKSDIIMF